jgi:hypothetical protein
MTSPQEVPPADLSPRSGNRWFAAIAWTLTVALCLLHGVGIAIGMGGWAGISSNWPPTRHDHPQHFHNALVARPLFAITGTNAGYDPSFMAGYAKSLISDSSSTISDLIVGLFGSRNPALVYKLYVFFASAAVPWLIIAAALVWRVKAGALLIAVLLFLIYVWSDFPSGYPELGMVAYFLAVPLGLFVTALLTAYLERGGIRWWVASTFGASFLLLVHVTTPLTVVPAVGLAYLFAIWSSHKQRVSFPTSRHVGFWAIPVLVLAVNAFWWLPAIRLASTKGPSDQAFAHPEPVLGRLWAILNETNPIEAVLCAGAALGLAALWQRGRLTAVALGTFVGTGFLWGYIAGLSRSLDSLQPGRQTYAMYTGASLLAAIGCAEVCARLRRSGPGRLDLWATVAVVVLGYRVLEPVVAYYVRLRYQTTEPFISSPPSPRLRRIVTLVERHVRAGERLLYEEGGSSPGLPDVFNNGERGSGLLPYFVPGIEVLGGPFLKVTLKTNFTQFGDGKLFGKSEWSRDHFVRYARLYRPAAIVCWSAYAREFCKKNPDLISILDDDGLVLFGRVTGFEGGTIEGTATVEAEPGRINVRDAIPGKDGAIVLRYHHSPLLRTIPSVPMDSVYLEEDPVPFIRLRPPPGGAVSLEIQFGPEPR